MPLMIGALVGGFISCGSGYGPVSGSSEQAQLSERQETS